MPSERLLEVQRVHRTSWLSFGEYIEGCQMVLSGENTVQLLAAAAGYFAGGFACKSAAFIYFDNTS
jgi:hypothetical protein